VKITLQRKYWQMNLQGFVLYLNVCLKDMTGILHYSMKQIEVINRTIVCSFQLGQADRLAYKLVNLARCIYYCSKFRFELKFYSLLLEIYKQ